MVQSVLGMCDFEKYTRQVQRISQEVVSAAESRDLQRAEILLSRLADEDSPQVQLEREQSRAVIERKTQHTIDSRHRAIWHQLYDSLSEDEQRCLFQSMEKVTVPAKQVILSHGAYNTKLFFIDSGKVTIIYPQKGINTALAQLGRGDLLGEYSFTSIALCSATAVSFTEVELYSLDIAITDRWHMQYPDLYEKVVKFCIDHGSMDDIARWKTMEKRKRVRYRVSHSVQAEVLTANGRATGTALSGELTNISLEGCAFNLNLSARSAARALLAKDLQLRFVFTRRECGDDFTVNGKIVKVSATSGDEYCLHLNFDKRLRRANLDELFPERCRTN